MASLMLMCMALDDDEDAKILWSTEQWGRSERPFAHLQEASPPAITFKLPFEA